MPRARLPPHAVALVLASVPCVLLVLLSHGLLPGLINHGSIDMLSEAAIRCTHDLGLSAFTSRCHRFGEPLGYPLLTGGPVIAVGSVWMLVPGVNGYAAYLLAAATFETIALAGGYLLMRRLGAMRTVALITATVYLISPTVIGMRTFPGTFTGYLLFPAYACVDLLVIDAVQRRGRRGIGIALAAYAFVRTLSAFMDGYSFVASALVSALVWGAWLWRSDATPRRRALGLAGLVGANAVAALLYELYVPGSFAKDGLDLFRSMGLDLSTLVEPSEFVWFADLLGLSANHYDLWGDASNANFNYVGICCGALAILYLATRPRPQPVVIGLAAAGAIAFALSLGPSLKVDDVRMVASASASPLARDQYAMPASAADLSLPWGELHTALPGIDSMRASYRWFGVTRLALVVLAGLAIDRLLRRRDRRTLALVVAALAIVELVPNLPDMTSQHRDERRSVVAFRSSAGAELKRITRPDERAFFLNYDGEHNDFAANDLASRRPLRVYNAGGDKNASLAGQSWPVAIQAIARPEVTPDDVVNALDDGLVDVVIAPLFHLRLAAYGWPAGDDQRAAAEQAFAGIFADPRLRVVRTPWLAAIRRAR